MYTMLIVDDDPLWLSLLKLVFGKTMRVDICTNVRKFYYLIAHNHYDIIIMDIALKDSKNGLDLIKELKSNSLHSETPILCISALGRQGVMKNALKNGADFYLDKPVDLDILKMHVQRLIQNS